MSKIKAVLFDLDGTLRDTSELIYTAIEATFVAHGLPVPTREELSKHIYHHAEVHRELASEIAFEDFERTYTEHFEGLRASIQYFPEAKATLQSVHDTYKVAIVTAARRTKAEPELQKHDLAQYVDVIVGGEDVTAHKPDPECILVALDKLGVSPDQAIYVGDMGTDMLATKAAKLNKAIGITLGFVGRDVLEAAGADFTIDSLEELLPLIEQIESK